jgi:DNA-directed RNA polymerase specialized sigma24 family protein
VSYTRDRTWELVRGWRGPDARTRIAVDDREVVLEVTRGERAWRMSLDDGPEVPIPGGRDWTVTEWTAGRRKTRDRYGRRWVVIPRPLTERLEPLGEWCRLHAERSITAEGYWFATETWSARCEDALPLPWIPEFDASRAELRRVARAEREHRELVEMSAFFLEQRREAIVEATAGGRSRRELADITGLSVARIQQIVHGA